MDAPSGELTFCYGKIHHAIIGKMTTISTGPCSIAMLVHQRVFKIVNFGKWPIWFDVFCFTFAELVMSSSQP